MQAADDQSLTPRSRPERRETASSILAKFLPNSPIQHKMNASHSLRGKPAVSYAESDGSLSPEKSYQRSIYPQSNLDDEDDEDEEIQYADKKSRAGRTIKLRVSLGNGNSPKPATPKSKRGRPNKGARHSTLGLGDELNFTPVQSDRQAVRHEIANVTKAKRDRFFVEKKDYFLPLLPGNNNYVKKLVERHDALTPAEQAAEPSTIPYQELDAQPKGITATMKPYQISGLSFMVYLHKNGLSGILGDEMGLGKTLQTLSLIQWLKENEPKTGAQTRPFLVVCPLSVLSSWMAEAKKWTPGLKVLRFHGPVVERERLKKIAAGEIDMHGNMTIRQKMKLNSRLTAAGQPVISLDSDEEGEGAELGVDVVVTTYESYQAEQGWFKRAFVWRYVILDEGHKVKNDSSNISKALQGMHAEYRLILTGTPLQNDLGELWALLHWLYPDVFTENSSDLFRASFDLGKGLYQSSIVDASRYLLELIMLRRMKNSPGVDLNLPPKSEVLLFVPLSPMQRFWYTRLITRADQGLLNELFHDVKAKEEAILTKNDDKELMMIKKDAEALEELSKDMVVGSDTWKETQEILARTIEREKRESAGDVEGDGGAPTSAWRKLMNLLMQLRKICNHPYQIPNAEPFPYQLGDHVIHASGKFIVLEKLVNELVIKQKKKILIFSGFTRMLDLVEDFLAIRGGDGSSFRSARLDGSTARARRNLAIRMFNDKESDYRVMLISTRAGGLGINLATASDVVMLDQDWNPQITLQAEARAHRIGQTNPVTIYKLVSQGTVEEQMMGRIQKKLYLSAKVTESMQDNYTATKVKKGPGGRIVESSEGDMPQLSTGQLMALVRRGASALSRPEVDVNEMLSWDWETTVAKCKDQPVDVNVKKDAIPDATVDKDAEQKWLSEMERVEARIFEGKKLERAARGGITNQDIAKEWDRADRRVGKNTTVMVDGFAISKESMGCADWEAVPTMAGKDPRLAEPKRAKKAPINAQSHCQVCLDGGNIVLCQRCPRAYHPGCLDKEFQSKAKGSQFTCPQHLCHDCEQKTTDAGGMLYRCRWCERAFCEDCLDWSKTKLIGDNLPEYEVLAFPTMVQAFYIECPSCQDHFETNPGDKAIVDLLAAQVSRDHEAMFGVPENMSMTDATTVATTTGVNTPVGDDEGPLFTSESKKKIKVKLNVNSAKGKRKSGPVGDLGGKTKKSKMG